MTRDWDKIDEVIEKVLEYLSISEDNEYIYIKSENIDELRAELQDILSKNIMLQDGKVKEIRRAIRKMVKQDGRERQTEKTT